MARFHLESCQTCIEAAAHGISATIYVVYAKGEIVLLYSICQALEIKPKMFVVPVSNHI